MVNWTTDKVIIILYFVTCGAAGLLLYQFVLFKWWINLIIWFVLIMILAFPVAYYFLKKMELIEQAKIMAPYLKNLRRKK